MTANPTAPAPASTSAAPTATAQANWRVAMRVASLFAVDPVGSGGVVLRAGAGPVRQHWIEALRQMLPAGCPQIRMPLGIDDDRLFGGLDLTATLRDRKLSIQRGLLADAHNGVVFAAMAERLDRASAARIATVLDRGVVIVARDGVALDYASHFGLIALDEGCAEDEQPPAALTDRMAFWVDLRSIPIGAASGSDQSLHASSIAAARSALPGVRVDDDMVVALCTAADALGIDSIRALMLVIRVARAATALRGADSVTAEDATLAAQLVLAPRARRMPESAADGPRDSEEAAVPDTRANPPENIPDQRTAGDCAPTLSASPADIASFAQTEPSTDQLIVQAVMPLLPPDLLLRMASVPTHSRVHGGLGKAGQQRRVQSRGRPAGVTPGLPVRGARIALSATLRAAAPWQAIRRRDRQIGQRAAEGFSAPSHGNGGAADDGAGSTSTRGVLIRTQDLHVKRFIQRSASTTIFVVDASGSAAMARLADAKGAVELLLAQCYVRRDKVAVIAFRNSGAELLLAPTHSLVRAKRSLAGLAGGGGTPLAHALALTAEVAESIQSRGDTPYLVLLTDGRANIARNGQPGRAQAEQDALRAAAVVKALNLSTILLDISLRPQAAGQRLAETMGARYLFLPRAEAQTLSRAVQAAQRV